MYDYFVTVVNDNCNLVPKFLTSYMIIIIVNKKKKYC